MQRLRRGRRVGAAGGAEPSCAPYTTSVQQGCRVGATSCRRRTTSGKPPSTARPGLPLRRPATSQIPFPPHLNCTVPAICDATGKELVAWQPEPVAEEALPARAQPSKRNRRSSIRSNRCTWPECTWNSIATQRAPPEAYYQEGSATRTRRRSLQQRVGPAAAETRLLRGCGTLLPRRDRPPDTPQPQSVRRRAVLQPGAGAGHAVAMGRGV